jgi:hypothetical protein
MTGTLARFAALKAAVEKELDACSTSDAKAALERLPNCLPLRYDTKGGVHPDDARDAPLARKLRDVTAALESATADLELATEYRAHLGKFDRACEAALNVDSGMTARMFSESVDSLCTRLSDVAPMFGAVEAALQAVPWPVRSGLGLATPTFLWDRVIATPREVARHISIVIGRQESAAVIAEHVQRSTAGHFELRAAS